MTTQHNFFILFQKFIANSKSGKRLKKDGSKIKVQSIANYQHCEKLLLEFVRVKKFDLIVCFLGDTFQFLLPDEICEVLNKAKKSETAILFFPFFAYCTNKGHYKKCP